MSGQRFAIGFTLGAIVTSALFYWFEAALSSHIAL